MSAKGSRTLFYASLALLGAALIGLVVVLVREGDLADAGDDLLPIAFAAAAIAALAGWWSDRRSAAARVAEAEQEAERRRAEAEREAERRVAEAEQEAERRVAEAEQEAEHAKDAIQREAERRRAEHEQEAERQRAEREREREQLRSEIEQRDRSMEDERRMRARLERAHRAEREWTRELRSQVVRMHREQGAIGHTGDVREMVLQVALRLTGADKGLLLSREDRDGDGELDLVCHVQFDNDPAGSAVAQEFAGRVLAEDETVREDDSSTLRAEGRTAADEEIHNLLAIPIFIQDDFEGVLVCANRDGGFEELEDDVLLALGDHAGAVLENGRLHGELRTSYVATVRMLAEAIEVKDPSVRLHSDEVAGYVAAVAAKLEIEPRRREELVIASLLHDVGKIGISERILLKPGPLTKEERSTIELHPRIGFRLVEQVPALDAIAPAVLHHHERYDGEGYPAGLAGEQIPLEARVICVADSFSAMTSQRPYRAALELEEACGELERCAGTQFDPRVVRLFVEEVRLKPPSEGAADGLAAALDDPEVRTQRRADEPVLGLGPVGATDNLTLLYGHRHLQETAAAAAERSAVQGKPFAIVLAELTGLEQTNSRDGFAAGDVAIREAAQALQRAASQSGGTACRYSGRRLALVLPEASAAAGEALGGVVAMDLQARGIEVRTGVAEWRDHESGADVLVRARLALEVHQVDGAQQPGATGSAEGAAASAPLSPLRAPVAPPHPR